MAARPGVELEFQRLHGMGEALYAAAVERYGALPLRVYAPVGDHEDLLPYLVRRLLENGANTSLRPRPAGRDAPPAKRWCAIRSRRSRPRPGAASAHPAARRHLWRPQNSPGSTCPIAAERERLAAVAA